MDPRSPTEQSYEYGITRKGSQVGFGSISGSGLVWVLPTGKFLIGGYPCQDSYLKKRESSWETDLVLAPSCGESKILSLVKTSRKDSKLRGLTRLSYSLDLRKDEMKTGDYPTLRRVFF